MSNEEAPASTTCTRDRPPRPTGAARLQCPRGGGGGAGGWRGGGFRVLRPISEHPANCVTTRKCKPGAGARRLEAPASYGKCKAGVPSRDRRRGRPRSPAAPLGPSRGREGARGCVWPGAGTAPTRFSTPGPCSEARLSWPGFGSVQNPAVPAAPWNRTDPGAPSGGGGAKK